MVMEMADLCWPFLSQTQPDTIRLEAISLFKGLAMVDADKVWWTLARLHGTMGMGMGMEMAPPQCLPVQGLRVLDAKQSDQARSCCESTEMLLKHLEMLKERPVDDYLN